MHDFERKLQQLCLFTPPPLTASRHIRVLQVLCDMDTKAFLPQQWFHKEAYQYINTYANLLLNDKLEKNLIQFINLRSFSVSSWLITIIKFHFKASGSLHLDFKLNSQQDVQVRNFDHD